MVLIISANTCMCTDSPPKDSAILVITSLCMMFKFIWDSASIPIVISNKHLINIELYILNLNLVVIIVDNTKNIVTIPPIFKIVFILLLIAFIKVLPKLFVEILMEFISLLLFLFLFRIIIPKRKLLKKWDRISIIPTLLLLKK